MPNLAQHLSPFDGLSRHCEEWSKTLETSQKRWKMAVLSMKKGFTVLPVDPVRGEHEIPPTTILKPSNSKAFSDYWFDCSTLFVTLSAYQGL